MNFKYLWLIIITIFVFKMSYASNKVSPSSSHSQTESDSVSYNPAYDPSVGCDSWSLWCDIKFGLKMAESSGVNGLMVNGYAYHLTVGPHWPTGYDQAGGVNEIALGAGYTRTFYNPQYDSEYSLYAMGFMDSFYKPEFHIGYTYEKYFNMTDSGNLKWGIGYTPFVFIKPALTNDAPIPLPGAGILTSIKYYNVNVMLIYANELFLNARIDF